MFLIYCQHWWSNCSLAEKPPAEMASLCISQVYCCWAHLLTWLCGSETETEISSEVCMRAPLWPLHLLCLFLSVTFVHCAIELGSGCWCDVMGCYVSQQNVSNCIIFQITQLRLSMSSLDRYIPDFSLSDIFSSHRIITKHNPLLTPKHEKRKSRDVFPSASKHKPATCFAT